MKIQTPSNLFFTDNYDILTAIKVKATKLHLSMKMKNEHAFYSESIH